MNSKIITPNSITFMTDGKVYSIQSSHPSFADIKEALNINDFEKAAALTNIETSFVQWSNNNFAIEGNKVYKLLPEKTELPRVLSERIFAMFQENTNFNYLLNFFDRLANNPSFNSVQSLYSFLEHKNIPITEDGHFLAYKAIRQDWLDIYSGTISNHIGATPKMIRSNVDDNPNHHCSKGLHVGSLEYVRWYGGDSGTNRVVIVKVDPADVVSVPLDHECQKVRCTGYTVLQEYTGPLPSTSYHEYSDEEDDDFDPDDFCDEFDEWAEEEEEEDFVSTLGRIQFKF